MEPKSHFYASSSPKGEKYFVYVDDMPKSMNNYKPISLETITKYLKLAYGIEIFILPCWEESTKEDTLYLNGYTYSVSKSKHFTHSLWNENILNNLIKKNGKKDNLTSLAPCYPTQELALVGAIKYILSRESMYFFENDGYTYSGSFSFRRTPHFTPYMVMTDDNVDITELYSFNNEDKKYYSVSDNTKFIEVDLDNQHFLTINSNVESWIGHIVFPIDNEEYGNYLFQQFTTKNE